MFGELVDILKITRDPLLKPLAPLCRSDNHASYLKAICSACEHDSPAAHVSSVSSFVGYADKATFLTSELVLCSPKGWGRWKLAWRWMDEEVGETCSSAGVLLFQMLVQISKELEESCMFFLCPFGKCCRIVFNNAPIFECFVQWSWLFFFF